MKSNSEIIKREAEISGLLFLGDGATISRYTLLNILVYRRNILLSVLEIVDCKGHLDNGNKKYGKLFCNQFMRHIEEIDLAKHY